MVGTTLAHYRILEKLGEGGMGAVYKAEDMHLGRLVVLKLLPAEKVADPERKLRFVQEAKAASALSHPNIIHVYDIDQAEGIDFIAMEYVPGKTLAQVIGRKGLPLRKALEYAVQIADAMARAHAAGIVHRDLKPSNIMVDEHGLVKVLDFGVAKLSEPPEADADESTVPLTVDTVEGVVLGTAPYMSPEQAEGKKVDARSDVFSFGAVLYEMVTGRRAFRGDSKLAILAAVLQEEPKPVSAILEGVPPELERVITRCLRKDPERRFQHMGDLKVELEELKQEPYSGTLEAAPAAKPRRRWIRVLTMLWVLVGAAVLGALVWRKLGQLKGPPQLALIQLTTDSGLTYQPAISPDGRLLAYASDRGGDNLDIWVQMLPRGEPIRLTSHEADDSEPSFSPDGTKIVFVSGREGGGIYTVPTLGGEAKRIAGPGHGPRFSPDGGSVAYWAGRLDSVGPILVVPSTGGKARQVPEGWTLSRSPLWTPDGKHLLIAGWREYSPPEEWWIVPLEGGQPVRTGALAAVRRHGLAPVDNPSVPIFPEAWIPGTNEVIFSAKLGDSTNLWKIGFSPQTWQVAGEPQRLTVGSGLERYPSAASGGRVVFSSLFRSCDIWSLPVDTNGAKVTGEITQLTHGAADDSSPSVSVDGKKMVFESNRTGQRVVWTKDLETGHERQITDVPSAQNLPAISRDGSKVAYSIVSYRSSSFEIYVVPFGGGGPEKICDNCIWALDWSLDGQTILYEGLDPPPPYLGLVNVISRQKRILVQHPKNEIWVGHFSPHDRWISLLVGPGPQVADFIVPFRQGKAASEKEWIPTRYVTWSPDGNRLYGLSRADGYLCIWTQRLNPISKRMLGPPQAVRHFHSARRSLANVGDPASVGLSIAKDKIVFAQGELTGNIWMAEPQK